MKAYQVHHPYPEHNCSLPCSDSNANVMKYSCSTNQLTKNMNIAIPFPTQRLSIPPNIWEAQVNRKSIKVWQVMTPRDIQAHLLVVCLHHSQLCVWAHLAWQSAGLKPCQIASLI